ncbi:MAG TPA: ABC transporter permease [Myxococcota bacterium]|nr:ABC transporter permease [Myxococcota bacterium]
MNNVLAIARRELGAYFDSPLAYFVVPAYVVLVGAFALWFDDLFATGTVGLRSVFFWSGIFQVLLIPAITMRLFAEERRTGSLEMLVTLPVREEELVLGKYLAAMVVVAVALASTFTYPITLLVLGTPARADGPPLLFRMFTESGLDFGPVMSGYFGLLLVGGALAAIGTAASSVTSSQIVAFLLAITVSIFPFVSGFFLDKMPIEWLGLVQWLSFDYHFGNFSRGVVDSGGLVFFGSVIGLALHIAVYSLERRRLG